MLEALRIIWQRRAEGLAVKLRDAFTYHQEKMHSDFAMEQLDNGLIRTSSGYYALAEDVETGDIVVLYSRSQKCLVSARDNDGHRRLGSTEFVYVVKDGVIKNKSGVPSFTSGLKLNIPELAVRKIISHDHELLQQYGFNAMGLHGGDVSDLYVSRRTSIPDDQDPGAYDHLKGVHMITNETLSLAIRENNDGTWSLRVHAPFERLHTSEPAFVETDPVDPDDSALFSGFLSNGYEFGRFDTPGEAFANLVVNWDKRSTLNWRGQSPIKLSESYATMLRTKIYDALVRETKNKENSEEATFDSTVEMASSALFVGRIALGVGLVSTLVVTVAAGFLMRKGLALYKAGAHEIQWQRKGPWSEYPDIAPYVEPSRENVRRIRKKPADDLKRKVRILGREELPANGINHNLQAMRSADEEDWIERWLVAFENKSFPTITFMIDKHNSVEICTNGLIRFVSFDDATKVKDVYARYDPAFDMNPHIPIPEEIKAILIENEEQGEITHVCQNETEERLTLTSLDVSDFLNAIGRKITNSPTMQGNTDSRHMDAINNHLQWVFNPESDQPALGGPDAHCPLTLEAEAAPDTSKTSAMETSRFRQIFILSSTDEQAFPSPALIRRSMGYKPPYVSICLQQ